jgi:hypothetical protein
MIANLLGVIAFLAAALVGVVVALRSRDPFRHRFPPISDAEFVARCPPGTDPAVALKVRELVARHFVIEYARVHPSMSFVEDIGAE